MPVAEAPAEVVEENSEATPVDSPSDNELNQASPVATAPAEGSEKPQPKFTPGMSVSEAITAVPKGWEYIGLDPEALGYPLADLKLYAPCNLTPAHHFKLRVAIWDGKAVGIDVTSANKKLAECVKEQVAQVTWRDKAKAINTVDFSY